MEGCSKNGKMTFWISKDERVTVPAPVSRNSLKLKVFFFSSFLCVSISLGDKKKVLNHGTSAKIGGASSVNYVMDEGSHFYLPGQTIFVQNSVIVEDVTWLSGKEEWVWSMSFFAWSMFLGSENKKIGSIALSPNSRVTSPSTVGLGAVESFDHDYNPDVLKKLVELKVHCLNEKSRDLTSRKNSILLLLPQRRSSLLLVESILEQRFVDLFWNLTCDLSQHPCSRATRWVLCSVVLCYAVFVQFFCSTGYNSKGPTFAESQSECPGHFKS